MATDLSPSDFSGVRLKKKQCAAVWFYAPWCGHCEAMKEDWDRFAATDGTIHVYKLDCDEHKDFVEKLNKASQKELGGEMVVGFPTIWYYSDGAPIKEHSGNRTVASFLTEATTSCSG